MVRRVFKRNYWGIIHVALFNVGVRFFLTKPHNISFNLLKWLINMSLLNSYSLWLCNFSNGSFENLQMRLVVQALYCWGLSLLICKLVVKNRLWPDRHWDDTNSKGKCPTRKPPLRWSDLSHLCHTIVLINKCWVHSWKDSDIFREKAVHMKVISSEGIQSWKYSWSIYSSRRLVHRLLFMRYKSKLDGTAWYRALKRHYSRGSMIIIENEMIMLSP